MITLEGVIACSDACVISRYDKDGNGFFEEGSKGRILIIEEKIEKPSQEEIFYETLKLITRLIQEENLAPGQFYGLAAHKAFVNALRTYSWEDNFEPYLNTMCNYKQLSLSSLFDWIKAVTS